LEAFSNHEILMLFGTAFSNGLAGDGFFKRVEWERLFRLGRMGTAFSNGLNEHDFLK
jgi:hypothetical protein